jgi:MoaA/NifB/PqqE/SkfB family radical SAM enzyme
MFFKSPEIIVNENPNTSTLELTRFATGEKLHLDARQSAAWLNWDEAGRDDAAAGCLDNPPFHSPFVVRKDSSDDFYPNEENDLVRPIIAGPHARWYQESPDLTILFNSREMTINNPLLVLGPYGSLCWRAITNNRPIGRIRRNALQVFGVDEVTPFLVRLADLGFIKAIPEIEKARHIRQTVRKEFFAPDIQFQLKHAMIPWYCLWEICATCNLRCKTCYIGNFNGPGPDRKKTEFIIDELIKTNMFYVSILGGEPLLRDDIDDVVTHLRHAHIFVKIITNGLLLSSEKAQALAHAGLNQLEISFDGLCDRTHDHSRGPGAFQRALQAIRNSQGAHIPRVRIVLTVHSSNVSDLPFLPQFLTKFNICECTINVYKKVHSGHGCSPINPISETDFARITSLIESWRADFPSLEISLIPGCSCGRTSVVIGDTGDIRLCPFSRQSTGNIFHESLKENWRKIESLTKMDGPIGFCSEKS